MGQKPFKKPPQAPPMFIGTPDSVKEDAERMNEKSKSMLDKIVEDIRPEDASFNNVLLPMAHADNVDALSSHILTFYQAVSANQAIRDASTEAEKSLQDYATELVMREDVFKRVNAAYKRGDDLDPESQKLLDKFYRAYMRNGMGLPEGPERNRYKETSKRLNLLQTTFSKNLNEEVGGVWFDPKDVEGVPEDLVGTWTKGEGENKGKVKMTFKYTDYFPVYRYASKEETRKKAYLANQNKLPQNIPLFREVIILRDEQARLLGYPDHATVKIEDKMAKTPKTVDDFLGGLRQKLVEGGEREKQALTELKKENLKSRGIEETFDGRYYLWDHGYYNRLMVERDFSVDQEMIKEYFPLETTIRGMLEIFETLFGLSFVEIAGDDRSSISPDGNGDHIVWHPDCQIFSVWNSEDQGGEFVGYLYLDLHPREGKYGHAANFNIQPGFLDQNGTRHYPCTALVCNFSKPTPKKPSLLKHDEVTTLFHELGHGIHDLVSRTKYSEFHGTQTVNDFVEAPSQMLENWCWTPSQLKSLSHHYSSLSAQYEASWREQASPEALKPDEKLPDEMIANLVKTRHVNDALYNLRQLFFGIFDMTIHEPTSHKQVESFDFSEMFNRLSYEVQRLDSPAQYGEGNEWGNGQTTFGHLIGGYDAGYYGYLYSQVYSADMFHSVFAKNPMDPKEGRRYRHMVLEKGGSQDEMKTLKDFLGREPSSAPFYKELGLE